LAGGRARRSSESIAASILESSGFKVLGFNRKVVLDGVEVAEIDIIAEKEGALYAVEVKAGVADVSTVRQAYVNALVAGMKPMIVARGVDEAAKALARRLGVEVIVIPDELLVSADDLREIVEDAVASALLRVLSVVAWCGRLEGREREVIEAIASTSDIVEAAERLGMRPEDLYRTLGSLRRKGILPPMHSYKGLKSAAALLAACSRLSSSMKQARENASSDS
jgi:predicted RecB family endonuclease